MLRHIDENSIRMELDEPQISKKQILASLNQSDLRIAVVNILSFAMIGLFSGSYFTLIVLGAYSIGTFHYINLIADATNQPQRRALYASFLILHGIAFVVLQANGFVGILNLDNVVSPSTLPFLIGFAFYILQSMAIAGSVYRRIIPPLDFQRYVLVISFCGAFLAGPIFNQNELKKISNLEIALPNIVKIQTDIHLLINAVLFKYVFANWLSQWVDINEKESPFRIARSVLCFEMQVYFDFAGYSLLALFLCRIFGLPIYFNFNHPFAAKNIPEFWRRWHIGLGTWFKENVYMPLKERKNKKWATRAVLPLVVFVTSAMWHGLTRNFLVWGLFHATAFIVAVNVLDKISSYRVGKLFSKIYVLVVVFYGRLLFMDSNFGRLHEKIVELGNFPQMLREISLSFPQTFSDLQYALINGLDNWCIGTLVVTAITYELFFIKTNEHHQDPYRYFKSGLVPTVLTLVIVLIFMQPIHRMSFVYGR